MLLLLLSYILKFIINIFTSLKLKISKLYHVRFKKKNSQYHRGSIIIEQRRRRRSTIYPASHKNSISVDKKKFDKNLIKIKKYLSKRNKSESQRHYNIFGSFYEQSGLGFLIGKTLIRKFTWIIIVLILAALSVAQCVDCTKRYLNWHVKTQIMVENVEKMNYPSLTFCNVNQLRKSYVGSNLLIHAMMAFMTIYDIPLAYETAQNSSKLCARENESASDLTNLLNTALAMKKVSEFYKYVEQGGLDSFLSVAKCWWNDKEFECKKAFNNALFEQYMCFTFNPNLDFNSIGGGDSYGYGFNDSGSNQKTVINAGRNRGLRILLNTHQEEYCGLFSKWVGAGFLVLIHDFDRPQSFLNNAPVSLSPGYHTNVAIKPATFNRHTEFMGTCTSNMDLFLIPLATKHYFDEVCYVHCLLKTTFEICKCLPTQMESVKILISKHYSIPLEKVNLCQTLDDMQCFKKLGRNAIFNANTNKYCQCKQPCLETKYQYQASQLVLPPKLFTSAFSEFNFSSDYKKLKKNFVSATFSFESMQMQIVTESQLFTIFDLVMYVGNAFGLFLGWSFTSILGLLLHVMLYSFLLSKKIWKRIKTSLSRLDFGLKKKKRRPTVIQLYF